MKRTTTAAMRAYTRGPLRFTRPFPLPWKSIDSALWNIAANLSCTSGKLRLRCQRFGRGVFVQQRKHSTPRILNVNYRLVPAVPPLTLRQIMAGLPAGSRAKTLTSYNGFVMKYLNFFIAAVYDISKHTIDPHQMDVTICYWRTKQNWEIVTLQWSLFSCKEKPHNVVLQFSYFPTTWNGSVYRTRISLTSIAMSFNIWHKMT